LGKLSEHRTLIPIFFDLLVRTRANDILFREMTIASTDLMKGRSMQCAFCKEEMNAGATVCKTCAREQPPTAEQRSGRNQRTIVIVIAVAVALPLLAFVGWKVMDGSERAAAVKRIVECAHLHGDKSIDAEFVNNEIEMGIQQTGKGWRAGAQYASLSMLKSGLPSDGECFVTQETLFSD
jgi:hypothetical protein